MATIDDFQPVKRPVGRPRKQPKPDTAVPATTKKKTLSPTAFGQDQCEPGDNSKYLGHALTIARMPLVDLNDIDAVEERIDWYFEHCFNNDMKPTVSGFCNALKISRRTLLDWRVGNYRKDTHQAVILEKYAMMEELWENYMQNGKINPVSGIFLGKNNYGYADKQEYVLTPNQQQETIDPKLIEEKYAELPED
jgi:hypothetical protein